MTEAAFSLIPERAVAVETRSAQVAVSTFAASETVSMIWRKTSPLAPKFFKIAALIKQR